MAIIKRRHPHPKHSNYQDYKVYLRQDFSYRCVYCAIHENDWGGLRHFHVEHFKPKSRFSNLKTKYGNLLYACDICNAYKGDDWPGYIDPCKEDYALHFRLSHNSFEIEGISRRAKYMVERLHLNRPHLRRLRKNIDEADKTCQMIKTLYQDEINRIDQALSQQPSEDMKNVLQMAKSAIEIVIKQHDDWWNKRWIPAIHEVDLK